MAVPRARGDELDRLEAEAGVFEESAEGEGLSEDCGEGEGFEGQGEAAREEGEGGEEGGGVGEGVEEVEKEDCYCWGGWGC